MRKRKHILSENYKRFFSNKDLLNENAAVLVSGTTQYDNNTLQDIFDNEDFPYHGEWDSGMGVFIFEEEEENVDDLAMEIEKYLEVEVDEGELTGFRVTVEFNL